MAEWLGTGLQNLLQRFDSAWYLQKCLWTHSRGICFSKTDWLPFYILCHSSCPAVLTEDLFPDNKDDVAFLESGEGGS